MAKKNPPIFVLPPYKVEQVLTTMSETKDWGLELLGIPNLWRYTKGAGVKVAVLDTGIALGHPDLRDAILDAKDFSGSRSGPADNNGHGTHVAGTIAARENSTGVIGVAPQCKLLIGKVMGDNGAGTSNSVAAGVNWAVQKGANIISMSLGSQSDSPDIKRAVQNAASKGILVICAAGNEGPGVNTVGYPGQYPFVVAVGSIDRRKQISRFSSRGPQVDIAAPGDQILSTWPPRNLAILSGTSMATPFVSGVTALMLSKHMAHGGKTPITNVDQLLEHLKRTATDAGPNGYDVAYGYGIIDPTKLVTSDPVITTASVVQHLLLLGASDLTAAGRKKIQKYLAENDLSSVPVAYKG